MRRGESRKNEYPFTKLRGKFKNKKASKTANFGANSMNPFNDKVNQGLKKSYEAHIVEE